MKFLDGGWLVKEGFNVSYAANIYDAQITENKLKLFAPFNRIMNMGMTLDGGLMTIEVTSDHKDTINVKMYHFDGITEKRPEFKINREKFLPVISETEDSYLFVSGDLKLEILKGEQIDFRYYYKGDLITESPDRAKAYVTDDDSKPHISEQLTLGVGEKIYGLGERFTNFVKNGQSVEMWNADGGTGTEQAYKNIPFYLSNLGYGVFVNSSDKVSFEIGSEKVSRVQFSVPGEKMEYTVIGGDSLKEVINNYTDLTGKPTTLPAWTFGLWLSTSFTTSYDEKTVNEFVDGMQSRGIPLSVFHFDCLWQKELEWCNFLWDEKTFPEPEKMLKRLKAKGLKICVWINPYIAQKSPLFEEGKKGGYFIQKDNSDVWQWDKWQAGMAIVDFTNPDAVGWYQSKLAALLAMGVDCFKTDFGERIPTEGVHYFDGSDPEKMHNYYTLQYNQAVFDIIKRVKGEEEAVVFARSATVGSQTLPVHWGGDSSSNYPSMAETLRAGLSFGLGGFGYWSHDISGFEAEATPDLYKRWTQFGLLSSHSRYHGSTQYKVPWLYGDEAVEVSKKFTQLKLSLMPYLMNESQKAHQTGLPMMRPMVLEYQDDPACYDLDRQYMLGANLLVAPIFNSKGTASFYVPAEKGVWTSILDGKNYEGGRWYNEKFDYFSLPLLAKPNSVIVFGSHDDQTMYKYNEKPIIHIFSMQDGEISTVITDSYGAQIDILRVSVDAKQLHIQSNSVEDGTIVLHNMNYVKNENISNYQTTKNQQSFDIDDKDMIIAFD